MRGGSFGGTLLASAGILLANVNEKEGPSAFGALPRVDMHRESNCTQFPWACDMLAKGLQGHICPLIDAKPVISTATAILSDLHMNGAIARLPGSSRLLILVRASPSPCR